MFAAPSMVSLLSGKDAYECEEGATYVTDCSVDGICYSCPAGHVGPNCLCPVGFTGPTCSDCNTGYSVGIDGVCKLDCTLPTIPGITDSTVQNGTGSLTCNADSNYIGSIDYSCDNNNFSTAVGASCTCDGRHTGVGCTSCEAGYQGDDCDSCAIDYTPNGGSCAKDCFVSGKLGIENGTLAIPPNGTLTCVAPYNISINYTCIGGVFNGDGCLECSGGEESEISVSGVSYKVHKFSLVGTFNFSCNGDKTVEYLVVAGGGGGGVRHAGGGVGGGLLQGPVANHPKILS